MADDGVNQANFVRSWQIAQCQAFCAMITVPRRSADKHLEDGKIEADRSSEECSRKFFRSEYRLRPLHKESRHAMFDGNAFRTSPVDQRSTARKRDFVQSTTTTSRLFEDSARWLSQSRSMNRPRPSARQHGGQLLLRNRHLHANSENLRRRSRGTSDRAGRRRHGLEHREQG